MCTRSMNRPGRRSGATRQVMRYGHRPRWRAASSTSGPTMGACTPWTSRRGGRSGSSQRQVKSELRLQSRMGPSTLGLRTTTCTPLTRRPASLSGLTRRRRSSFLTWKCGLLLPLWGTRSTYPAVTGMYTHSTRAPGGPVGRHRLRHSPSSQLPKSTTGESTSRRTWAGS